jgi:hypothetical protein
VTPSLWVSLVRVAVIAWVSPELITGGVVGESVIVIAPPEEHPAKPNPQRKTSASPINLNFTTAFLFRTQ